MGEQPPNAHDASMFFILHPDPASNQPLTLEMELIHNGKAGKRTPLLHSDGEHAPIPYLASIGSRALPSGEYEVKAFIKQGDQSAEQSGHFTVTGTPGVQAAMRARSKARKSPRIRGIRLRSLHRIRRASWPSFHPRRQRRRPRRTKRKH
jgi:hypothetical protein